MKVKITYLPGEEKRAYLLARIAASVLPKSKVKERQEHPPYRHIYISSKPPECPADTVERRPGFSGNFR